jgi:hypothetical protein
MHRIAKCVVALIVMCTGLVVALGSPAGAARSISGSHDWSDPAAWQGGRVPASGAAVEIASGSSITLDQNVTVAGLTVDVRASLVFDATLSVSLASTANVIVYGGLTMIPSDASLTHRLDFVNVNDSQFVGGGLNPVASDVGLWVMGDGVLNLRGAAKTSWTNLVGSALASATSIRVADATGWRAGDQIFIAPTQPPSSGAVSYTGFDNSSLNGVNGNVLSLQKPLTFDHPQVNNTWTAEVGNLTRNVTIDGTAGHYSHVFIRSTRAQTVKNVELDYMGVPQNSTPSGVLGRYALHFHMAGNGSVGSVVDGVVVAHSGTHAFVPHGSNGVDFENTVAYDVGDDAYWWDSNTTRLDTSNSSDNVTIKDALAAKVTGGGQGASGFCVCVDNVALSDTLSNSVAVGVNSGTNGAGYRWSNTFGFGSWTFDNNVAHNNKTDGLFSWANNNVQTVTNFTAYNNRNGIVQGAYKNAYHYANVRLYGNSTYGVYLGATARSGGLTFADVQINGAGATGSVGFFACCHQLAGTAYATVISNSTVTNTYYPSVWSVDPHDGDYIKVMDSNLGATGSQHCPDGSLDCGPYYFGNGTEPTSSIEVQNATDGHFVLTPTRSDPKAKFETEWNAWKVVLP